MAGESGWWQHRDGASLEELYTFAQLQLIFTFRRLLLSSRRPQNLDGVVVTVPAMTFVPPGFGEAQLVVVDAVRGETGELMAKYDVNFLSAPPPTSATL